MDRVRTVDQTDMFEAERPRLVALASRVLGDHAEAQDVVHEDQHRHRQERGAGGSTTGSAPDVPDGG